MNMKFENNCNSNCWECSRKQCKMKDVFSMPEPIAYKIILDFLKPMAGYELTLGIPKTVVDENLKKRAVALKIARDLYLKNSRS